jgi:hypothetical protein
VESGFRELVASLDRLNQTWVAATRRISPRLLCELLAVTGEATRHYLTSLDRFAVEEPVSWIRPDPVPNWLDVARQYTERWTHQQQIRDAVGLPGLKEPAFMAPVLDAETAWRLWTKGIRQDAARAAVSISGDRALGLPVLDAVAIIG